MMIRRGWSQEYGKQKFDVEVDETDLHRELAEHGAHNPLAVAAGMTVKQAYTVLDSLAMMIVHDTLRRRGEDPEAQQAKAARYQEHVDSVLERAIAEYDTELEPAAP